MKFFAKLKWVASILLVFFIVLITNIIDRENFNRLSYSVTTMYEDRIVACDLIFEMSSIMQKKQVAALTSDTVFFTKRNEPLNQELQHKVDSYSRTRLTEEEKEVFTQLKSELIKLKESESRALAVSSNEMLSRIQNVDMLLNDLSKIQIQEGKRQVSISNRAKDAINLFTQGEIIFLIIMAVLVQIIILYKPK
ncbi:MAG: MCP four helix bundle domain-containing protein [Crocinitomicaceae bacterium]|jgi:hypothetical protein|nr:MCP four helix bundle domain-containing protein [Crocinitomicaceae bacterium]